MLIDAASDFSNVRLGDARLDRRLLSISRALQERPSESFPRALGEDAALEGFYRFLANERVTWRPIFDAHVDATRKRAAEHGRVLAIHDTTLCQFSGEDVREGTFRTSSTKSGFFAHTCLAVSADGQRQPLGLLDMIPVVRLKGEEAEASPGVIYEVESERWHDLVLRTERETPAEVDLVHVMDSEGDAYPLLARMVDLHADFVVRLCHNRRVQTDAGQQRLMDVLPTAQLRTKRTVRLSRRQGAKGQKASRRHAARDERMALLELRSTSVELLRPPDTKAALDRIRVHVVHVVERNVPEGQEPVSWVLATTLPIDTMEEVEAVVDAYRARWLIEEWFKSLKTGCAYEKRQLESMDALLIAFALLAPTATRLLALRWMGRNEPERPATDVFSEEELDLLRLLEQQRRRTLPKHPTVADAMLAIARLGGFLTRNKIPGWQVLGRGFEDFQKMFKVYKLMRPEVVAS